MIKKYGLEKHPKVADNTFSVDVVAVSVATFSVVVVLCAVPLLVVLDSSSDGFR